MASTTRNYFRRLAEGYEDGLLARGLSPVLDFASGVYGSVVRSKRSAAEKKDGRKKLPFPVVSVGNLTWGGTGKTPLVEFIARRVGERNRKVLILTRGYGADESEQFRSHLQDKAVVGVGKDRYQVAQEILKNQKIDFAILDDGLQHWPIHRDLEIIAVSALNPFGNRRLIPRGILREPLPVLSRASMVVISHANLVSGKELEAIKAEIRQHAPSVPIIETYLEPLFFYRAKKRARVPLNKLENQKVATFSGVGAPRSFQLMLSRLQLKPIRNFEFSDHHRFTDHELKEIKEVSDSSALAEIITTEKDFFRCQESISEIINPLVLATRLRISSGEGLFMQQLARLLESAH